MFNSAPLAKYIASRTTAWTAAGYAGAAVFTTINAPAAATFLGTHTLIANLASKIIPDRIINDNWIGYGVNFVTTGILAYKITQIAGLPLTIAGAIATTALGTAMVVSAIVIIYLIKKQCCAECFGIGPNLSTQTEFYNLSRYFIHGFIRQQFTLAVNTLQSFNRRVENLARAHSSKRSISESESKESSDGSSNPSEATGGKRVHFDLNSSSVESTRSSAETIVLKYVEPTRSSAETIGLKYEDILAMTIGVALGEQKFVKVDGINYKVNFYKFPHSERIVLRKNESSVSENLTIMLYRGELILSHNDKDLPKGSNQLPEEYVKPWQALCKLLAKAEIEEDHTSQSASADNNVDGTEEKEEIETEETEEAEATEETEETEKTEETEEAEATEETEETEKTEETEEAEETAEGDEADEVEEADDEGEEGDEETELSKNANVGNHDDELYS